DHAVAAFGHGRRPVHEPDFANALGVLSVERILGDARSGHPWQETTRAREGSPGQSELTHGDRDSDKSVSAPGGAPVHRRHAARLHAMVAGDCALLPPEIARGRRAGFTVRVL